MTLKIVIGFLGVHVLLAVSMVLGTWLVGGAVPTFAEALVGTPAAPLVGEDSIFGEGSLDKFDFKDTTNLLLSPVTVFYGMFSFNYDFLDSDGIAGIPGTLLSVAGHAIASWLIFDAARAGIGGFLSFLGR